ncbi:agmatine deiminase family protein [Thiosocius teredinicola]|uniref:agmatine deiminase family protein n=1 Tax=Thiosocius teredinicola TaxID=1973002 RepID=UPI000990D152
MPTTRDSPARVRLPAEWEPQSGVMLTWPHAATDWADVLERVEPVFAQIGAAIAQRENLLCVCHDQDHAHRVTGLLTAAGADAANLRFAIAASDDTWARDHGALVTLAPGGAQVNDFVFNGWGGKFEATQDSAITALLYRLGVFQNCTHHERAFILEGGAIETDGAGTLLATRSSVISETRNAGLTQAEIEKRLSDWLGFERFLWLDHGDISGDDTDGHVDTLARFTDEETIVYATAPQGDADYAELAEMAEQLAAFRTRNGKPYHLLPLPFPGVHVDEDGRRLPATYANFLFINGAVLLPIYGVDADRQAIEVMREACPQHEIVPIDCRAIIEQNGSLHCLTMQFPTQITLHSQPEFVAA